jgi:hypothetical protein
MSALGDFEAATAVEQVGERAFRSIIPDGWQQGRGAFGGLVLGTLLRAIVRSEPDPERAVRTLAGDICGPVLAGHADIQVRVLRRGSNQSNLVAELTQGGAHLAIATAVLSRARPSQRQFTRAAPPSADDWQSAPVVPIAAPMGPTFAQHYEYRLTGAWPFSDHPVPETAGWIREQKLPSQLDAPAIVGRLDAWWPTLYVIESQPRPCGTIQFTAELLADPASLDPAAPLRYRAEMISLREGFFVEARELWRGDELVALNHQTFVIIK